MATNEEWTNENGEAKKSTFFIDVQAWGKSAEILNQYGCKGKEVLIVGKLRNEEWEDKQTREKRRKIVLVVGTFQLGNSPKGAN